MKINLTSDQTHEALVAIIHARLKLEEDLKHCPLTQRGYVQTRIAKCAELEELFRLPLGLSRKTTATSA